MACTTSRATTAAPKVILIGNVGKDPEVRYNPNGVAWCQLSLATSRTWKNRETGERQEETEWHRLVFNDRLAEVVGEYITSGSKIYVEGRLKTRKWRDKEGRDVYTTEVIVDQMQMLGDRKRDEDSGRQREDRPAQRQQRAPAPAQRLAPAPAPRPSTRFDDMDDDIPF